MEAGPMLGVWTETLDNGFRMFVDTRFNIVRIQNPNNGHSIKYEYEPEEGIKISDIIALKAIHGRVRK